MRSRSYTILSENDIENFRENDTELSDDEKIKSSLTKNFVQNMNNHLPINSNLNYQRNFPVRLIQNLITNIQHSEEWQENETFILLKAIDNCIKENDHQRLTELKKEILCLEYNKKDYGLYSEEKQDNFSSEEITILCNEDEDLQHYPNMMNEGKRFEEVF